jgi:HEAT repeat protein
MAYAEETQEQQVERLIKELQDPDSDVRSIAAVTLGEIGSEAKDAVPALIQLLQDQDAEGFVRANAALALREIGPEAKDAVPALIQALQDQNKDVRKDAARALGNIGKDAMPALIQTLKNRNIDVRSSATWTLGVLRLMIVIGFIGVSGALIMTIWFGIVMWKHIVLRIEMGSDKGYHSSTKEDYSEYLGQTGVALTVLRPAGTAMIDNKTT